MGANQTKQKQNQSNAGSRHQPSWRSGLPSLFTATPSASSGFISSTARERSQPPRKTESPSQLAASVSQSASTSTTEESRPQEEGGRRASSSTLISSASPFRIGDHINIQTQDTDDQSLDPLELFHGTPSSFISVSTFHSGRFSVNSADSSRSSVSLHSKFTPTSSPAVAQALEQHKVTQDTSSWPPCPTPSTDPTAILSSLTSSTHANKGRSGDTYTLDEHTSLEWRLHEAKTRILNGAIHEGFSDLLSLANRHPSASVYYALGVCYYRGWCPGNQPDKSKAFRAFERAATLVQPKEASRPASTLPDATLAQYIVARMMMAGADGGPRFSIHAIHPSLKHHASDRPSTAFRYLMQAAQQGHPFAQLCIGNCHVSHNEFSSAERYYRMASHSGLAAAQVNLAKLLLRQLEQPSEPSEPSQQPSSPSPLIDEILSLLGRAADQNSIDALRILGSLYEDGRHVEENLQRAVDYYARSFTDPSHPEYGHVHHMIACHYKSGHRTLARNDARARHHFELSARVNYGQALRELGNIHAANGTQESLALAHTFYTRAAQQNDVIAMGYLGKQFEQGQGCAMDYKQATFWYSNAATMGSLPGKLSHANLLFRLEKYAEAFDLYQSMAAMEITKQSLKDVAHLDEIPCRLHARVMVAKMRMGGYCPVSADCIFAFQELQSLVHLPGLAEVHYLLGGCYRDGLKDTNGSVIVAPDAQQAVHYFLKGAEIGDLDCHVKLGEMYFNGFQVKEAGRVLKKRDRRLAFDSFQIAASQGHAMGCYYMALYYLNGIQPVPAADMGVARDLLTRASNQGVAPAMVALAQCLLSTTTSTQNISRAHGLLIRAKDMGDVSALRELALMYEKGLMGVDDPLQWQEAYSLMTEAARRNDVKALCELARYHEKGVLDGSPDPVTAAQLLTAAVKQGYTKAKILIAELQARTDGRESALLTYQQIVKEHEPFTQVGWYARMGMANLVLQGAGGVDQQKDTFKELVIMTEQRHEQRGNNFMDALELLGLCYEKGVGVQKNIAEAARLYLQVLQYHTAAPFYAARERTRIRLAGLCMQRGDQVAALEQLSLVEPHLDKMKQDPATMHMTREAQYYLGCLYMDGIAVPRSPEKGRAWLKQAADQGSVTAFYKLGELAKASGDETEAKYYFERGMEGHHPGSTREYGLLLLHDSAESDAIDHLERAVNLNDSEASFHLGIVYLYGIGTIGQDLTYALEHFRTAVQLGYPRADVYLGEVYYQLGDRRTALDYFMLAPHDLISQLRLPLYRLHGWEGHEKDAATALKQLQDMNRPFDMGNHPALSNDVAVLLAEVYYWIGYIHDTVLQNQVDAMSWYKRAVQDFRDVPFVEAYYQIGIKYLEQYRRLQRHPDRSDADIQSEQNALVQQAHAHFKRASNKGHGLSKYELGNYYRDRGDMEHAEKYYNEAIQCDIVQAMIAMGDLYFGGVKPVVGAKGRVILQSFRRAFQYYLMAAERGHGHGACMVATYYDEGYSDSGIHPDPTKALAWYKKAFEWSGDPHSALGIAQINHAMAVEAMNCTPPDRERAESLHQEAHKWFCLADAQSNILDKSAQSHIDAVLGLHFLYGLGRVKADPNEAFIRLNRASGNGNTMAFEGLVHCYERGIGTDKDYQHAANWLLNLVTLSNYSALLRLRKYKDDGFITEEYYREAERQYQLAADQSCVSSSHSSNSSMAL